MEITIDTSVFDKIMSKLELLETEIKKAGRLASYPLSERWLDIEATCKVLNCSKRNLRMYRLEHGLPHSKIVGSVYFRAADVEKFLNEHWKIIDKNSVDDEIEQNEQQKRRIKK